MTIDRKAIRWNGWGWVDREDAATSSEATWAWIAQTLGLGALLSTPALPLEAIDLPATRLSDDQIGALKGIIDPSRVHLGDYERAFHARGKSYHDLLHLRAGRLDTAPDAVVYPTSDAEILDIYSFAEKESMTLVPYGGGSSVVGGVSGEMGAGKHASITIDLTLMNRILSIDEEAMTAVIQAGIYGPHLEEQLQAKGFTLGHYPQSFQFSTLGGWIAARGAGQQSNRYGKAEKWLVAVKAVTPKGTWTTESFPASAAGPNLNQLVLGSEGAFGIVTEAIVKIHKVPQVRDYRGFLVKDFETGAAIIRDIVQKEIPVAMTRLSDGDETNFFQAFASIGKTKGFLSRLKSSMQKLILSSKGLDKSPCLLLIGQEGDMASVSYGRKRIRSIASQYDALHLGTGPGEHWYQGRFDSPYSRDPMLDHGLGVDTLETSTRWSNISHLYQVVKGAIEEAILENVPKPGSRGIVMTHISHAYSDGASLYFTFVFPRDLEDEIEQWQKIKQAASDAIVGNGGTISHHHGVGTDHAPWMEAEKGEIGIEVLRQVKKSLDESDILNPGKLLG